MDVYSTSAYKETSQSAVRCTTYSNSARPFVCSSVRPSVQPSVSICHKTLTQ